MGRSCCDPEPAGSRPGRRPSRRSSGLRTSGTGSPDSGVRVRVVAEHVADKGAATGATDIAISPISVLNLEEVLNSYLHCYIGLITLLESLEVRSGKRTCPCSSGNRIYVQIFGPFNQIMAQPATFLFFSNIPG